MKTTKTNYKRSELFAILDDVVKELKNKLYSDFDNIDFSSGHQDTNIVSWESKSQQEQPDLKIDEDGEDSGYFNSEVDKGLKVGFTFVTVKTNNNRSNYKTYKVILISSKIGDKTNIIRTNIRWYEHLHPSVIRLKKLLKLARQHKLQRNIIKIEHDLAKIIPNRIDHILLGDPDDNKKDGNS